MSNLKKLGCLVMTIMCLCSMVTSAYALSGTVDGPLRLRDAPRDTATIIGWLKDGDVVTVTNTSPASGWYAVSGTAYQYNNYTGWCKDLSGYVMSKFIS